MAVTQQRARRNSSGNRKRVNGKFATDPDKEAEPFTIRHKTNYRRLRNAAMRLLKHLEHMMPEPEKDQPAEATDTETVEAVPTKSEGIPGEPGETKTKELNEAYERLLGRSDGIINGFNTLALLVIRLIDKERESRVSTKKKASSSHLPIDENELDRQILEELDLIAQARGSEEDIQKAS